MKTRLFTLLVLGLVGLGSIPWRAAAGDQQPGAVAAPEQKTREGGQDFIFLGDARPVFVRLHVEINGKPLAVVWDDFVRHLFGTLDTDQDGTLSTEEAAKAPPAQVLFGGGNRPGGSGPPAFAELDTAPSDGRVTPDELARHYRSRGGPFHVQVGAETQPRPARGLGAPSPPMADALNGALFARLDRDQDGKLSETELASVATAFRDLDFDEDDLLAVNELLPGQAQETTGLVVFAGAPTPAPSSHPAFHQLAGDESRTRMAEKLLARYRPAGETSGEGKLTAKSIGLDEATFKQLDRDRDGALDARELAGFTHRQPDLELVLRLGGPGGIDIVPRDGPSSRSAAQKAKDGTVSLDVGITRLEVRSGSGQGPVLPGFKVSRQVYSTQLQAADKDTNGYLDLQEAQQAPAFRATFALMDRDGDGKLFEKEMFAYLDQVEELQGKVRAATATLTIAEQGRGLFDQLDSDRDGKLSIREMRRAGDLAGRLDRDEDRLVGRSEIPRGYQLSLSPGIANANQFMGAVVAVRFAGMQPQPAPAPLPGPVWFRKMDRNRDGDVSRREFLGTEEQFRQLDADGDGLISKEEAAAGERAPAKAQTADR
jgi:Ca2+-binding EF-hand superfamily protein